MQEKQEKLLYEYAIVHYLPSVEREEFVNVGLIMMCKRKRWIKVEFHIDSERLFALHRNADIDILRQQLEGFRAIAAGTAPGQLSQLETHERFRWLTAVRSACIATSRPHPGLTADLDQTFTRLFHDLILPN